MLGIRILGKWAHVSPTPVAGAIGDAQWPIQLVDVPTKDCAIEIVGEWHDAGAHFLEADRYLRSALGSELGTSPHKQGWESFLGGRFVGEPIGLLFRYDGTHYDPAPHWLRSVAIELAEFDLEAVTA